MTLLTNHLPDTFQQLTTDIRLSLKVRRGHVFANSRDVAARFGKQHKNVIRDIKSLECSDFFRELNFEPTQEKQKAGATTRTLPSYNMTRDGFVFLVMGFTGKEAAKFKEAYIHAFNQMESAFNKKNMDYLREGGDALTRIVQHSNASSKLSEELSDLAKTGIFGTDSPMLMLGIDNLNNHIIDLAADLGNVVLAWEIAGNVDPD